MLCIERYCMIEDKKIYLSKPDAEILFEYCKGCRYFDTTLDVSLICSMVGWYRKDNIKEVKKYIKGCPCIKCLVKASCMEEACPIWKKHVYKAINERSIARLKEKC